MQSWTSRVAAGLLWRSEQSPEAALACLGPCLHAPQSPSYPLFPIPSRWRAIIGLLPSGMLLRDRAARKFACHLMSVYPVHNTVQATGRARAVLDAGSAATAAIVSCRRNVVALMHQYALKHQGKTSGLPSISVASTHTGAAMSPVYTASSQFVLVWAMITPVSPCRTSTYVTAGIIGGMPTPTQHREQHGEEQGELR